MRARDGILVDIIKQAYEDELKLVLDDATKEEAAIAEESAINEGQRPTAPERFKAVGERIMDMTDEPEHTGSPVRHEEYAGIFELGVSGLAIALKARRGRVNASFMPWQFSDVEARWIKNGDVDSPVATEAVSVSEVSSGEVEQQVYGMLNLIEQSLDTAELARTGLLDYGK